MNARPDVITHPLEPVFDEGSRVIVLGTMPSPVSREVKFYYGHPRNRFWRVLALLFDAPVPQSNEERTRFVLERHIALWDVLASCTINGASDASIRDAKPQNLKRVFENSSISCAFTTGSTASAFYRRFHAPLYPEVRHIALPSTSAANARMSLDDLVAAYRPLLAELERTGGLKA